MDLKELGNNLLVKEVIDDDGEVYPYCYIPISTTVKKVLADPLAMEYIMKFHRGKIHSIGKNFLKTFRYIFEILENFFFKFTNYEFLISNFRTT